MKGMIKFCVILCVSVTILIGCSLGSNKNEITTEHSSTLKVMFFNEEYFYQEYGMLFSAIYPNIQIETVNTDLLYDLMTEYDQDYNKALKAFIDQQQPDVILLDNPNAIQAFIEDGTFLSLESLVSDVKYNADGLIPGLVDYMREIGSGTIYSLPTSFNTQLLFYNKDLFDQYNIPYPTDQMTWSEIVNIAKKFPVDGADDERLFGLKMGWSSEFGEIVNELATSQGITYFDAEALQMTMDTPAWAAIIEQAIDIIEADILFYDEMLYSDTLSYVILDGAESRDPFLNGRLAMKFESTYYINEIKESQKYAKNPNNMIQNWDIVTAPVSSFQPDSTTYTNFYNLVAINSNSAHIDAAKTYVSYITSDDYARVKSNLTYSNLPVRTQYLKKDQERNYEAIYKLKPLQNNSMSYYHVPQRFLLEFDGLLHQTLMKITEGQLTVEQALAELQLKGNELLATKLMTEEEYEQYWNENDISGVI